MIMSTASRYQPHYKVEDYLQWEGRWELWSGTAVAMSPSPTGRHAEMVARLVMALGNAIEAEGCSATVLVEIDWIVARDTVVRPDVTVVCGTPPKGHVEQTPAIVVEVLSAATRERDLVFKRALYAEQRVPIYVIADPDERRLEVVSRSAGGHSTSKSLDGTSPPLAIDACGDCRILLDPTRILR